MNDNRTKIILLIIGSALIVLGLIKPKFNPVIDTHNVDVLELIEPSDENLKKEALDVFTIFKKAGASSKNDSKKLRDLYLDLAQLISLDGNDLVIKNTEEIRQANSIAGAMFRLNIKDKYPELSKEANDVVLVALGDDHINLTPQLRTKAVEAFDALAWACNESNK